MKRQFVNVALTAACALALFGTACHKKTVAAAPLPPPPPPVEQPKPAEKPVISSFTAEPSTVVKGSPSTLRWAISGASDVSIDQGIGSVQASGSRQVYPSNDTTYTLIARGVGGTSSMTVSVRVTAPEAPPVTQPTVTSRRSASEFLSQEVQDAFFDYDSFSIRDDARGVLTNDASALKRFFSDDNYTGTAIVIEGHCDERGSDAYNVALGDKRAQAALEFLKGLGVAENRLKTVSFGKERQSCSEQTEACWQQNRRVHFAAQ
ncbi:MAG: OmpA family protein [Acidobacteria bacterium]|nr:OmpA family protein [Acidobacteriota bacterium]